MSDEKTTPPSERDLSSAHASERVVPALVIVWSADEPARVGEIALLDGEGGEGPGFVLGRGDEGDRRRASFHRQRPGIFEKQPALGGNGISREQLFLRLEDEGVRAFRRGQPGMKLNGDLLEEGIVRPGDTIEIERRLLLYCVERPVGLPALRHGEVEMPFGEADADGIVGESPAVWALRDAIAYAREAPGHVLVTGESGTGKELTARAIRARSPRAKGPLVSQNAATLPSGLIDAELFGNARNYPNPGMPERAGLVGAAHGGVLFLDEIGELPPELHARLLRVLDAGGEYRRLGETEARRSDFRLIAATNRDPSVLKHDLLSRLQVRIALPSLRDRREDVPFVVRGLVLEAAAKSPKIAQRFVREVKGRAEVDVAPALMDGLVRLPYTTNVREISAALSAAMAEATGDVLPMPNGLRARLAEHAASARAAAAAGVRGELPSADEVRAALAAEGENVTRASVALGISRQALHRLMDRHGLKGSRG